MLAWIFRFCCSVGPRKFASSSEAEVLSNVGQEHEISAGCIVGGRSIEEEPYDKPTQTNTRSSGEVNVKVQTGI